MFRTLLSVAVLGGTADFTHAQETPTPPKASAEIWTTDFAAAKKAAAEEKKTLLVNFTGTDWCHWCIRLDEEVFSTDTFTSAVTEKFIPVKLDYPQDKSGQSEKVQQQNKALAEVYPVQGFPTILLLDAQGRPFAQTGYQPGGPKKYLAHLDDIAKAGSTISTNLAEAEKQEGPAAAASILKAFAVIPPQFLSFYQDLDQKIRALDPDDSTGYAKEQGTVFEVQALQKNFTAALEKKDFSGARQFVDDYIKKHQLEGEKLQSVAIMKVDAFFAEQKREEGEKLKEEILAIAPESKFSESIREQDMQAEYSRYMESGKYLQAIETINSFIEKRQLEGSRKQELLAARMDPTLRLNDFDAAAALCDQIIAVAPESEIGKMVQKFKAEQLPQIKAQASQQQNKEAPSE